MNKTYRNKLPKGLEPLCSTVSIENGEVVVNISFKEPFNPKDGDFCVSSLGNVFIYCSKELLSSDLYCGCYCVSYSEKGQIITRYTKLHTKKNGCRYATPEEKAAFLERLEKECHKHWNEETKQLEDIRWRAEKPSGIFYCINGFLTVIKNCDIFSRSDNDLYEVGNYFRTPEAATKVADQIKEIFKNSKAE